MILQTNFSRSEVDYNYWENIYTDKTVYEKKKTEVAEQALKRLVRKYPFLEEKIHVIDVWSPMTYTIMLYQTEKQRKNRRLFLVKVIIHR